MQVEVVIHSTMSSAGQVVACFNHIIEAMPKVQEKVKGQLLV